jgi:serine/threonine protein phosphatase 1
VRPARVNELLQEARVSRQCSYNSLQRRKTRPRKMSFTYVVPDIHGRFDLLCDGLAHIVSHAAGQTGTIVALGDYVDKGPDSKQVIDLLRAGSPDGWLLFPLKGNHDAMMVEALRNPAKMDWWRERGGDAAIKSYGGDPLNVPPADIGWLDQLPVMHIDHFRIYVHAGLDPDVPLDQQTEKTLLWSRYPKEFHSVSVTAMSSMATIHLWTAQNCTTAGPTSIPAHGGPAAW